MRALHTIEPNRPTRIRRVRLALVDAAVTHSASHVLAAVTDSRAGKKLSYAWSPGGLLNLMTDNEGHRTDYLYDSVGRLTGIWAPNYDYVSFVYDAGGRLTEKWFPNGINAQYTWNNDSTLAQVRNRFNYSDTFIVSQHDYSYNGVGQRKSAQDKLGAYTPPAMNEAYAYDPLGNRTTKTDGSGPLYYVYDAANQLREIRQTDAAGPLLAALVYDANGNLTQKCEGGAITQTATSCTGASIAALTYDALNRLAQVDKDGQLSQYAYDDANRRIRKTVGGSTTNYLYNGPDIQAEYQNWSQASASYTHGTGINGSGTDDPVIRITAANDASYFHQDGLGSVVATTDQSGNLTAAQLYDAWGKPQQGASLNNVGRYGYTGREPDETGMMYYRARYYDPSIGRFTQRDPIGLGGGINQYSYVENNPVSYTDPEGLFVPQILGGLFNAGVGALVTYSTGGGTWQQYARNAAADFTVGALSSGVAGLAKVATFAKVAQITNTFSAKAITAAGGEIYKGITSDKNLKEFGTNAVISGALNATGIVGKVATSAAKKLGYTVAGDTFNPSLAAVLQPNPGTGAAVKEIFGSPANFATNLGNDYLGKWVDGGGSSSSQSVPTMTAPDPSAGGLFGSCNSVVCVNQSNSNYSGSSSVVNAGKIKY